jgi:DsbC/DsbD-like thiol-disulfide interchange protein/cytochrome c biogenesis protein CcdA
MEQAGRASLERMIKVLAALMLTVLGMCAASARESAAVITPRDTATLITDTDAIVPGRPLRVALRLRLAPGWHTYWQNPGDAGLAPDIAFTLPPGAAATPIAWPAPQRVAEGPVMTFAYTGDTVLPATITPAGAPLHLQAHASWLVCSTVCVPEEAIFTLDLPAGQPGPSAEAPLFAAAAARTPVASPYIAHIAPDGVLSLAGDGLPVAAVRGATFFPAAAGVIDNDAPQRLSVRGDALHVALHPGASFDAKANLAGLLVLRDVKGGETYLDIVATPGPAVVPGPPLARMLLFALAGGLILNLMPCVFPVLAMKALGLARLSGEARGTVRGHALSYTAGVVLAFLALGSALLALRSAGQAAGWGFQFQSPVFVAAMAWLLFGVGLNLSGVFAVGAGFAGTGQALAGRHGHTGSFFTGLLAVLVATPCTAPFMGAAIAGAVAAPPGVTLLVFGVMGLGLALPYTLLAAAPGLARLLPRPGVWMDVLKQALAFPMYGAAAWLVWVVSQEAGSDGVLGTASGMVALGFAAWALGWAQRSGRGRRLALGAAIAGVAATLAMVPGLRVASGPVAQASAGSEPFSPARLAALREAGRPVFVNMTAAWCVSCLVNERIALAPHAVQAALAQHHVAYLKGDWTRQDPVITTFLRDHGRDGVPLYLFYAPGQAPAVLPQILTESAMLDRINHSGG